MVENRQQLGLQDYADLFGNARSEREFTRAAEGIVYSSTEESFDILSLYRGINIGMTAILGSDKKSRQYGRRILDGINGYISTNKVTHKSIIDPFSDTPELDLDIVRQLSGTSLQQYEAIAKRNTVQVPLNIADFIARYGDFMREEVADIHAVMPIVDITIQAGHHPEYIQYRDGIHKLLSVSADQPSDRTQELKVPERTVTALTEAPGLGNILPPPIDRRFGTTTLRELLAAVGTQGFSYENLRQQALALFDIMNHVPKGDQIWVNTIKGLFFTPQKTPIGKNEMQFEMAQLTEGIFHLQQFIAEKICMPALSHHADSIKDIVGPEFADYYHQTAQADPEFDEVLESAINTLDLGGANRIEQLLASATTSEPFTIMMFHPELDFTQATQRSPLALLAHLTEKRGWGHGDEVTMEYMKKNWPDIQSNIRSRFKKHLSPNFQEIDRVLDKFESDSYKEIHTSWFTKEMRQRLGDNFLERLNEREQELDGVSSHIWGNMSPGYWVTPDMDYKITFSQNTLMDIMGFDRVLFRKIGSSEEIACFISVDQLNGLMGKINPDGSFETSAELGGKWSGLHKVLRFIAMSTFHDLVRREEIVLTGEVIDKPISPPDVIIEDEDKEKKPRKLPRKMIRDLREHIPVDIESDELRRIVDENAQEHKGFTPRVVDLHKRGVPYSIQFEQALTHLLSLSPESDDYDVALSEFEEAKRHLTRPSEKKLANLPPKFQLKKVVDHEGRQYTVETWVIAHSSPRPTEEEQNNPQLMYKKYFEGGSALAFADYIRSWIVE